MATTSSRYPEVASAPSFPAIEERILARWKAERIFEASVENRPAGEHGEGEYVFYDGPPFANGLPHYGHLLTGYIKDVVPRYQTMRGKRVERRFGWDCHGLPAELETEKQLGISGRQNILDYGIDRFNEHCRQSVFNYREEWESFVARQARWVDFENDYKTLDRSYTESCLWAFKELWDKGLVYESYRVLPYSWAAESIVSNFETRMDNSYRERQDPAITVRFRLHPQTGDPGSLDILVWTTTPWTLPSNLALAVGPEIEYALLRDPSAPDADLVVIGAAARGKYEKELGAFEQVGTLLGSELVGRTYEPMFEYFKDHENSFRVLPGDFIDTEEGTGVVHMAPGFGEDDQRVCEAEGIAIVCPVDGQGKFTAEVSEWAGTNVLEANKPIIRHLKERGVLLRHETYLHSYPHCWRTDEPLIYRAVSSWYVQVTALKDRMLELNQEIRWIPEHVRDGQFGRWLENVRDWSISRNRFWGAPIPIWKSDDPAYPRIDVYGSLDELERDFGVRPDDLHRPTVDELTRPNPDDPTGKSTMRRVEEVFDCWFESGSMAFAQVHYPFEKKQWFEDHFPADFVSEYVAQTRGWFYTMHVLATALFDRPAFKNCVCHGVVVDEDGKKLSKRLRNYPSPEEVFSTYGSDALRWFLVTSPILRGADLAIDRDGKSIGEVVRLVINPIWNAYSFFCLYANTDGVEARFGAEPEGVLDRYILAKTRQLVETVGEQMDAYDLPGAGETLRRFLDALNNWYIRRSRPRFWKAEKDADKQAAYDTLYTVLTTLCRVAAPLLPLITEEIHTGLTGAKSVHLEDWPDASVLPQDDDLVADMDRARDVCSTALGLRTESNRRVRLPLQRLTVAAAWAPRLGPFSGLVCDEVNVKEFATSEKLEEHAAFELKVNARVLGPRLGGEMKTVLAAARAGEWTQTEGGGVRVGEHALVDGEYELRLVPRDAGAATQALPGGDGICLLDVEVTPELEAEGLARDVVRQIQIARKAAALDVSDRVDVTLDAPDAVVAAVRAHVAFVSEQTLALQIEYGELVDSADATAGTAGEGLQLRVRVVPRKPA